MKKKWTQKLFFGAEKRALHTSAITAFLRTSVRWCLTCVWTTVTFGPAVWGDPQKTELLGFYKRTQKAAYCEKHDSGFERQSSCNSIHSARLHWPLENELSLTLPDSLRLLPGWNRLLWRQSGSMTRRRGSPDTSQDESDGAPFPAIRHLLLLPPSQCEPLLKGNHFCIQVKKFRFLAETARPNENLSWISGICLLHY